jgi:cell division protein ZapA (FtsZ GTPase activity inhibitor)
VINLVVDPNHPAKARERAEKVIVLTPEAAVRVKVKVKVEDAARVREKARELEFAFTSSRELATRVTSVVTVMISLQLLQPPHSHPALRKRMRRVIRAIANKVIRVRKTKTEIKRRR